MPNHVEERPYHSGFAVTKSDTTVFTRTTDALWVGGVGDVAVHTAQGSTMTFSAVPAGTKLPIKCDQVLSTGTTATLILGLYY